MVDVVECGTQVRVKYPPALRVLPATHDMDDGDRVLAASTQPEPIGSGREPGLPLRFQCITATRLVDAIGQHGNSERSAFSIGFRYEHSADRLGLEGSRCAVHQHGQIHPGAGGQRDLPVHPCGPASSVALRYLPHAD
jgi:hypothetical protein